jgi:endonuclease V-like protein UPF0215 family
MQTYLALVVVRSGSSRHGGIQQDNTIVGGVSRVTRWESGVAEETSSGTTIEADGVDVEISSATLPKRLLHRSLSTSAGFSSIEPVGVDNTVGASQVPSDIPE